MIQMLILHRWHTSTTKMKTTSCGIINKFNTFNLTRVELDWSSNAVTFPLHLEHIIVSRLGPTTAHNENMTQKTCAYLFFCIPCSIMHVPHFLHHDIRPTFKRHEVFTANKARVNWINMYHHEWFTPVQIIIYNSRHHHQQSNRNKSSNDVVNSKAFIGVKVKKLNKNSHKSSSFFHFSMAGPI